MKTHDTQISMINKLKDDGILEVEIADNKVTKTLIQFNEAITKMLKYNNFI